MCTLNAQALAAEGTPIPSGRTVRVELVDSRGTVVEHQYVDGAHDADALSRWVGNYVMCLAAEGMTGSVRWSMDGTE